MRLTLHTAVFLAAGLAIPAGVWGPGVASMWMARAWQPAEAEVVFAGVGIGERGDRQDAHRLVAYAYHAGGRERLATRLDFFAVRGDSESSARAFAERHPAGRRLTCFVDPADPASAVLDRHGLPLDWVNGLLALMAAAFLAIGVTGLAQSREP